ncbi:hemin-degrading factor [Pseudomonas sp. NY15181]|uniref:hemin-degrading factor n=1 Tax=Pseudomonas sp. NY15181 TaxID=3400349 RepID=UPI003A8AB6E7
MTIPSPKSRPAPELYRTWQALCAEQPRLRARDAARRLGGSEAELTASRLSVDAVRLRPEWSTLLPALGELGEVMALTRNEHCVHERKGPYREVTVSANGQMGLVVSPDIDLRLFLGGWHSAFAISEETGHGIQRSLQVFDRQGTAVHKVFLTDKSAASAWAPLVRRFRAEEQSEWLDLVQAPPKAVALADGYIDVAALQDGWATLKDTHHFFALLKKHGVERAQALRLAGREWAEPLDTTELPRLLESAGERCVPIMIFVGNAHCIQIHTGTVDNLKWLDDWFNILDPLFNLHLNTSGVRELWRVRKPSSDGVITSWEAFDAAGELVLQVFGARKPGVPELQEWRSLAESFPAR